MGNLMIEIKSRLKGTVLGTYLRRRRWNANILSKEIVRKKVDQFMAAATPQEKNAVIEDVLDMARKYRFSADEYFYYHFRDKAEEERKTFVSDLNRVDIVESLNQAKNLAIFDDKLRTVDVFGKYYHRQTCGVKSEKDLKDLIKFARETGKFIVKPQVGTCGHGIRIVDMQEYANEERCLRDLIRQYCNGRGEGFIAEELIRQVPELAQFHHQYVNTVRIATVRFEEGSEVLAAFFRTGRSGSAVDNVGSGGVFGTLDVATGEVVAVSDAMGRYYTQHPDTGVQMVGFKVPRWEEAKAMAIELASVVKGNRYGGWDLALTENGWVLVEANARGQFVWQIPTQKGFMDEINAVLRRLGMPEMKHTGI